MTVAGERAPRSSTVAVFRIPDLLTVLIGSPEVGKVEVGPTNESGAANRPTRKESEKLRVARVARNMPKSSKEKHCRSNVCCFEGEAKRMMLASNGGRSVLMTAQL